MCIRDRYSSQHPQLADGLEGNLKICENEEFENSKYYCRKNSRYDCLENLMVEEYGKLKSWDTWKK